VWACLMSLLKVALKKSGCNGCTLRLLSKITIQTCRLTMR
ncbi:putative dimethyl sulfoxide reductase chain ynfE domain protein, partial [Vibrio parahaemolyticus V-223/04]